MSVHPSSSRFAFLGALLLAALPAGCVGPVDSAAHADSEDDVGEASQASSADPGLPIITVSGYGNYCSKTWPATGGWEFSNLGPGSDPCGAMDPDNQGKLQRQGLYNTNGWNDVVLRCDGLGPDFWTGWGADPLGWAYNTALGHSNCIFNVSPRELRVFTSPFSSADFSGGPGSGFDHATGYALNTNLFEQNGNPAATKVDFHGHDKSSSGAIDDHLGYDWGMPIGTPLRAVATGRVIKAESFTNDAGFVELHVFIEHTVCGPTTKYCEKFVSYYTHLSEIDVMKGQDVIQGQLIARSGNSGGVPAHLHFGVMRLTNTADQLEETFGLGQQFNQATIDPFGWEPLNGPDPWGFYAYPNGAMSIDMWVVSRAPSTAGW